MVQKINLPLTMKVGIFSEETPRQAGNYYKNGDYIRFRNGLPEKLGGWTLQSNGTTDGVPYGVTSTGLRTSVIYGAGAATITSVSPVITAAIGQKFWIFDDSLIGGFAGGKTITPVAGSFLATVSGAVTAAVGNAVFIDYPEGNGGAGYAISSGTTTGSIVLTVTPAITVYLLAGSLCVIPLLSGGEHVTTLRNTLISGATSLTLTTPLPSAAAASPVVRMYAPETVFRPTTNQGVVLKILANAPAASTSLIFTTPLTQTATAMPIDIRVLQEFAVAITHTTTSTLTLTPATTNFALAAIGVWPDGAILQVGFFQNQNVYKGICRALHEWTDLSNQNLLALGTECKLYVVSNSALTDITPVSEAGTLANNPFTTVASSQSVNVLHVGHQQTVGNFVTFSGATAAGGLTISGEYRVITLVDVDNYTITAAFPANANSVGGGAAVTYSYDIDCGQAIATTVRGWGTGSYGSGAWGVGDGLGGLLVQARVWSLDNFGEDLLASPTGGSLYFWDRGGGGGTIAVVVPTAPASIQRMLVSPQARQVIAVGADLGSAAFPGDPDPLLIRFSDQEDYTDWTSTSTNAAGDIRLDVGSKTIAAIESRGDILVFTDVSLHALQYIGSPLFFTVRHLGQSVSIAGPNAACDVNGIVYAMTLDVFLIYDGTIRVMESPIESYVFDNINRSQGSQFFVAGNKLFTEVLYFYPSLNSTVIDSYAKYNYTDDAWDYGTMARTAWADSGPFYSQQPFGTVNGVIFAHENSRNGQDENGITIPIASYLETYDMEIDQGFTMFHVARMVPDFKNLEGSISLTLSGRTYPQGPQKSKGPFTVDATTRKVDVRIRSKQISFKISSANIGDYWRFSEWRAEGVPHGRRGGQ